MILREMSLPAGWYPRDRTKIEGFLKPHKKDGFSRAAIASHAGWYYSGACAAKAVSSLESGADTVAVIGGHLPAGMPVLAAYEDAVKTPLGAMELDAELRESFQEKLENQPDFDSGFEPDRYPDNTVEVLLPMVHYFFPKAKLLHLRFPAALSSFEAGKLLASSAASLGRHIAVLASTDLTHYGSNYGFSPKGRGKAALEWVKNVNDSGFINAVLAGKAEQVLKHAEENYSACSAGAVLGVLGFAAAEGITERRLLEYCTSADAEKMEGQIPDSFVGYTAVAFMPKALTI